MHWNTPNTTQSTSEHVLSLSNARPFTTPSATNLVPQTNSLKPKEHSTETTPNPLSSPTPAQKKKTASELYAVDTNPQSPKHPPNSTKGALATSIPVVRLTNCNPKCPTVPNRRDSPNREPQPSRGLWPNHFDTTDFGRFWSFLVVFFGGAVGPWTFGGSPSWTQKPLFGPPWTL